MTTTTTTETKTEMAVANEIRRQLGRALFMLGAQNLGATSNSLSFKIRGSKTVSHIKVELTPADEYDVTFYKVRGNRIISQETIAGIYCDMLATLISDKTGLATSL